MVNLINKQKIKNMKCSLLKKCAFAIAIMVIAVACDENVLQPLEGNKTPPGQIENVSVENLPGKAKITYALPSNQDLLYIKAEYKLANGETVEVKASYYNNSIEVVGFGDTDEHEVSIYAVNRSEVASAPVMVTVQPLESNIWDVYRSLEIKAAFGGIFIKGQNEFREDISILAMEKNELGDWEINPNSIYTSTDEIAKTIRGMDTIQKDFAFTVRDRWLNHTDTLFTSVKPLFEVAIPKSGYTGVVLPGDTPRHTGTPFAGMWDDELQNWPSVFLTQGAIAGEHVITIDTGVLGQMSRIVIWDYPEYFNGRTYYYIGNLKKFEVWGSDNPPTDGSFDNWYLLGEYNAVKPSGLPYGEQTNEDYETALAGFSWDFDIDAPKVRYLRIKSIKNWGGIGSMAIGEIQVYGNPN